MANHLTHLLKQWHPDRDAFEWVLGTVIDTYGPCYRKRGAMMLFSSVGQQFGMLSGGCLESDIGINARKVMQSGRSLVLCYDGSDEDDLSFQLGIGCGGMVTIMLQLVNAGNDYLLLEQLHQALTARQSGLFYQQVTTVGNDDNIDNIRFEYLSAEPGAEVDPTLRKGWAKRIVQQGEQWLVTPIKPEPHLLVAGGGVDAQPLVLMAHQLGWQVSLWDPRPANARREHFIQANTIFSGNSDKLAAYVVAARVNVAIVMTHSVTLDAGVLAALQNVALDYVALLGPVHRRDQVLAQAGVALDALPFVLAGPAGLDIGAQLPESIALSMLAECHASLKQTRAQSLSGILTKEVVGVTAYEWV
jgi:xanthine dehydrogenase accessory factor